ncbi:hypothetical protein KCP69_12605 [Salmonella enterica subsp. enterica]|nr:hypothetical protein KCP69_12605 [Salmonella enterica subsp. enterica]
MAPKEITVCSSGGPLRRFPRPVPPGSNVNPAMNNNDALFYLRSGLTFRPLPGRRWVRT